MNLIQINRTCIEINKENNYKNKQYNKVTDKS